MSFHFLHEETLSSTLNFLFQIRKHFFEMIERIVRCMIGYDSHQIWRHEMSHLVCHFARKIKALPSRCSIEIILVPLFIKKKKLSYQVKKWKTILTCQYHFKAIGGIGKKYMLGSYERAFQNKGNTFDRMWKFNS